MRLVLLQTEPSQAMRSMRICLMDFSTVLRSFDMHAHDQMYWIGGKTLKVSRMGGEVSISTA
jgi:hypothetical protein